MIYEKAILMTSNEEKTKEFQEIMDGLSKFGGKRIKSPEEIKSQDPLEVILHKTKDMLKLNKKATNISYGSNRIMIVEDTSLMIDGHTVGTDIKYVVDNMEQYAGCLADWNVYLGVTNGTYIEIYMGSITGNLTKNGFGKSKFSFDRHFMPNSKNPKNLTLSELQDIGQKHLFSARTRAINSFNKGSFLKRVLLSDIPAWTGEYQEE
jgi:inosine/xanthosine triphosphate pyrophosphatase family protein